MYCIYCSKCLCSCTIELNKTKKQEHNFIPLSCAPFSTALIWQNEVKVWHIFVKLSTEAPCSKKNHQKPSLKIQKKSSGSDQILGLGGLRQTNFFLGLRYNINCMYNCKVYLEINIPYICLILLDFDHLCFKSDYKF